MIEFRSIRKGEWENAMTLWTTAFGDVGWIFEGLNRATSGRLLSHTKVAVSDEMIVSAVDIFIRQIRDAEGTPRKVGAIGSVATYESFRKQGLSGTLLKEAIETMKAERCDWSFLFTGVHSHYEKYGWFRTPLTEYRGKFYSELSLSPNAEITELDTAGELPLEDLSSIYDHHNARRPLTHLRDLQYWQHAVTSRLQRPAVRLYVMKDGARVVGYLVASYHETTADLEEIGTAEGFEHLQSALLNHFALEAQRLSKPGIVVAVALDSPLKSDLAGIAGELIAEQSSWSMSRSISSEFSHEKILEIFNAPGAVNYRLDGF